MAKIYTKVGDKGQTGLVGGHKVSKSDTQIWCYGTVDELNSAIGLVRSQIVTELTKAATLSTQVLEGLGKLENDFEKLQHWMFDLGSLLASRPEDRARFNLVPITEGHAAFLEKRIDEMTSILPKLTQFILPAGHELACRIHLARTVCRRAERLMVEMGEDVPEYGIPFINRLSDYLFTSGRYVNHLFNVAEVTWKKSGA